MENCVENNGEKLHSDVALDIFNRVPREAVLQCRKACKSWRTIIGKPPIGLLSALVSFSNRMDREIRVYYAEKFNEEFIGAAEQCSYEALANIDSSVIIDHSYLGRDILRPLMVGSCNGLVCFHVYHHDICDPVYIYNPLTGEHTHLPEIVRVNPSPLPMNIVFGGFGYCQSTNEYKVIGIYYDEEYQIGSSERVGKVQVYTLGGGTGWRDVEDITYNFTDSGVFAYEAVYWLDCRERCSVVAFDLEDEMFQTIPSPPLNIPDNEFPKVGITLLGGKLCVYHTDECTFVDIWTLDREKNCWMKEFVANLENSNQDWPICQPIALTNGNELQLWYNYSLCQYEMKTSSLKKLWEEFSIKAEIQAVPHMHSLVSLEALGEIREEKFEPFQEIWEDDSRERDVQSIPSMYMQEIWEDDSRETDIQRIPPMYSLVSLDLIYWKLLFLVLLYYVVHCFVS